MKDQSPSLAIMRGVDEFSSEGNLEQREAGFANDNEALVSDVTLILIGTPVRRYVESLRLRLCPGQEGRISESVREHLFSQFSEFRLPFGGYEVHSEDSINFYTFLEDKDSQWFEMSRHVILRILGNGHPTLWQNPDRKWDGELKNSPRVSRSLAPATGGHVGLGGHGNRFNDDERSRLAPSSGYIASWGSPYSRRSR